MRPILTAIIAFALTLSAWAQTDTMFVHHKQAIYEFNTNEVDSVIFYRTGASIKPAVIHDTIYITNVSGMSLSPAIATMAAGQTLLLTATVLPSGATNKNITWTSSNVAAATVTDGTVTAVAAGKTTIFATTVDGDYVDSCMVTVAALCNNETPGFGADLGTVSFKTSQTWTVGNQEWSDVVTATNCQKEEYNAGSSMYGPYSADCRKNEGYGDLFSWCAVVRFQDELCPDGWNVPAMEDFAALNIALGGDGKNADENTNTDLFDGYVSWGVTYGGRCSRTGGLSQQGGYGYYQSQSEYREDTGYGQYVYSGGSVIHPLYVGSMKYYGLLLRCVKYND